MVIFQQWKVVQNELLAAIDNYTGTTIALEASLAQPWSHFLGDRELQEAISLICSGRTAVLLKMSNVYESEVYFNRIQNRSKKLAPISSLPPEILIDIFILSCGAGCSANSALSAFGYPVRETHEALLALTQVCSSWRSITTNVPQLWSHIDIAYRNHQANGQNNLDKTRLWLERARNTPLSVHFSVKSHLHRDFWRTTLGVFPYLKSATSLCFGPARRKDFFTKMIMCWLDFIKPGQVQTLECIGVKGARTQIRLDGPASLSAVPSDPFLSPIRVLRLHNTYFGWDSVAYHGLVELHLGYLINYVCPTIGQMVGILSACPEMRILRLQNMTIWNPENIHYGPVSLRHLEVLDVTGLEPDSLAALLPILAPGSGELSLRGSLDTYTLDEPILRAFLKRSNVIRLFLQGWGWASADIVRPEHLSTLKNLRILIFDLNYGFYGDDRDIKLRMLIDPPGCDKTARRSSQWPQLHTLYLINGQISAETVRSAVESCRIQKLRIASCYMEESQEDLQTWLEPVIQDVRCEPGLDRRILVRDWYKHMW